MLHIAVCDDECLFADRLENIILSYARINKVEIDIKKYCDGNELLEHRIKFDVIFLDIEMNKSNGIETAVEIRKLDLNVLIIYIISYSDYWRRAYKVHAFDFIEKPIDDNDIFKVLDDIFSFIKYSDDKKIQLTTENGIETQVLNEIYYCILLKKKRVQVSTIYREYIVKENLTDIFEKLSDDRFYMSHRSCIVNLKHIKTLKKNDGILMTNGEWLPLAQKKQKDFFLRLSEQLRT